MEKTKTVEQLSTPSDLYEKGRQDIANHLNPLVADAFALYVKTKNYHWHVSGSYFRDYHLLFDEQAEQIFAMIDLLAERVRKLGSTTIHSVSQIKSLQSVKDDNEAFVAPQEMINNLLNDNRDFIKRLRVAHEVCDNNGDNATTSILEILIDEAERRVWFLFETLKSS